jgi:hypothetical protein
MKHVLALLASLTLVTPACVIRTTAPRPVGALNTDGSVFLGWHHVAKNQNQGPDREAYDVGAQLGNFSSIRLHADSPVAIDEVLVIFANGERWVAPGPLALAGGEWSQPIPLPGGARPIHSVVLTGRATTGLLSTVEVHGAR